MSAGRAKNAAALPAAGRPWPFWWDKIDLLFFIVVAFYTLTCPFTKVEESFQVQATHDLLIHGANLDAYDHHEFPGVVPRSFVAPLLLAVPTFVLHRLVWFFWAFIFPLAAPVVSSIISVIPFPAAIIADAWDADVFLGTRVFFFSLPPAPVLLGAMFPAASSWAARVLPSSILPAVDWLFNTAASSPPVELVTLSRGVAIPALRADSLWLLIAARLVLAALSVTCWACLRAALRARCDPYFAARVHAFFRPSSFLALITCSVFHLPFYASRPIANVFATNVIALAVAAYLLARPRIAVAAFAAATIILRCDLVIYAPFFLAWGLYQSLRVPAAARAPASNPNAASQLSPLCLPFTDILIGGGFSTVLSVAITVGVDSLFWRRAWSWPELEVLLFNTVQNKSHLWGTSPWYWYAAVALPRLCLFAAPALLALLLPRTLMASVFRLMCCRCGHASSSAAPLDASTSPRSVALSLVAPAAAFIACYSFLPHKELRFIFPALPALYSAAAIGAAHAVAAYYDANVTAPAAVAAASSAEAQAPRLTMRARAGLGVCAVFIVVTVVVGYSGVAWSASVRNYPGGYGLVGLNAAVSAAHVRAPYSHPVAVHLSNLACTTGATRFGQLTAQAGSTSQPLQILYLKTEGLNAAEMAQYPPEASDDGKLQWLLAESQPRTTPGFVAPALAPMPATPAQFSIFKDVMLRGSPQEDRAWVLNAQAQLADAREVATHAAMEYADRLVALLPPVVAPTVRSTLKIAVAFADLLGRALGKVANALVSSVRVTNGTTSCAEPVHRVLTWDDAPGGAIKICIAGAEIAMRSPGLSMTTKPVLYLHQRGGTRILGEV
jgi:hypothetical protein